ncbi:Os12g0109000 [Oryza sativa Japonica Group]|uniref:Uncharacterized protein n=2 Tax=Oryza sativa subsp. japonica TaxID=39947 RepID=Q2QYR4_ORYSJ|nr:hypothetical protein LOC_Os12g01810 [Oryza sativa Japonica Group]BAH95481.1 Os12g0109000 [Oryza sativa Japonica Group]|eukprot:NP_001176753.1 Os12g0109000 [Oryza sativa Japonica Group]
MAGSKQRVVAVIMVGGPTKDPQPGADIPRRVLRGAGVRALRLLDLQRAQGPRQVSLAMRTARRGRAERGKETTRRRTSLSGPPGAPPPSSLTQCSLLGSPPEPDAIDAAIRVTAADHPDALLSPPLPPLSPPTRRAADG